MRARRFLASQFMRAAPKVYEGPRLLQELAK